MQATRLGRSGLQVSRLCLGYMTFGSSQWRAVFWQATGQRPVIARSCDPKRTITPDYTRERYYVKQDFIITGRVQELAQKKGVQPIQIALAWVLHAPGVTSSIIGARNMTQFQDRVTAMEVEIAPEERTYLEAAYQPKPVRGHE